MQATDTGFNVYSVLIKHVYFVLIFAKLNMASEVVAPCGLMGSCSLFGIVIFLFRKCFKIALF